MRSERSMEMAGQGALGQMAPAEAARRFLRSLKGPCNLLIAISGGSDSTGLLLAFDDVLKSPEFKGFALAAVTVDHGLREESAEEAHSVAALCARLGVAHQIKRWNGDKPKSGLSQASREARYNLLVEAALEFGSDLVLLGHTLGDQRETIAMRRQRNADPQMSGLAGMAPAVLLNHRIWACRPFLMIERGDIRAFLTQRAVTWIDDPSNDNVAYERVRLRNSALADDKGLVDEHQAGERYHLSEAAAHWFEQAVEVHPNMLLVIDRMCAQRNPREARYALGFLSAIIGGRPYTMARHSLDRLWPLIAGEGNARMSAHRCLFDIRKTHIYLHRENRDLPEKQMPSSTCGLWDQRFYIAGQNDAHQRMDPAPIPPKFPLSDVPGSIARRAQAAMPQMSPEMLNSSSANRIELCLRPFDQFLPLFDYAFASVTARAFGRSALPEAPFAHSLGTRVEKAESF